MRQLASLPAEYAIVHWTWHDNRRAATQRVSELKPCTKSWLAFLHSARQSMSSLQTFKCFGEASLLHLSIVLIQQPPADLFYFGLNDL